MVGSRGVFVDDVPLGGVGRGIVVQQMGRGMAMLQTEGLLKDC